MSPYVPPPGSIPTLEVPDVSGLRRVHMIGIGGAGMRNLARLFLARGVSVTGSDLKDSQSMVQPAMMLIILAYLASFVVMRAPESGLSVGLSMFPTITPFAMMLRLVMPPGPPLWQVLVSVALLIAATAAVVWAAGRIFRVGLLMQGKPPNIPELLKWIRH